MGANVNQDDEESTILRDGAAKLHQFVRLQSYNAGWSECFAQEDSSVPDPISELMKARDDDIREQKIIGLDNPYGQAWSGVSRWRTPTADEGIMSSYIQTQNTMT